jgi:hypothetical protein
VGFSEILSRKTRFLPVLRLKETGFFTEFSDDREIDVLAGCVAKQRFYALQNIELLFKPGGK